MRRILSAAVLLSLAACAADNPRLPRVPVGASNQAQLADGRHQFAARCSTCHGLPAIEACTKDVMDSMAPAAALKPAERAAIEAYLAAVKR